MKTIWVCRSCVWGAKIEIYVSPSGKERYVCHNCCTNGNITDLDAPIQVTEAQADTYWYELQNQPTFIPGDI